MRFDLIFFQAGVDGLKTDELGLLHLTRNGMIERNRKFLNGERKWNYPCLFLWVVDMPNQLTTQWMPSLIFFLEAGGEFTDSPKNN